MIRRQDLSLNFSSCSSDIQAVRPSAVDSKTAYRSCISYSHIDDWWAAPCGQNYKPHTAKPVVRRKEEPQAPQGTSRRELTPAFHVVQNDIPTLTPETVFIFSLLGKSLQGGAATVTQSDATACHRWKEMW